VPNVISAEGSILERILDTAHSISPEGLSRPAYAKFCAAQMKTAWGRRHQRRLALVEGDDVLASATQYDLAAVLDQRPVRVRGIGSVLSEPADCDGRHAQSLVSRILERAERDGAALALLFLNGGDQYGQPSGFETVSTTEMELTVAESTRHGAPMTLIRGGEERDWRRLLPWAKSGLVHSVSTSIETSTSAVRNHKEAVACRTWCGQRAATPLFHR
jgi:hypothetical protein